MTIKKSSLLILGILPLLGACSFPGFGQKEDFTSLYIAHTKSQVESFRTFAEKLGYVGKYETKGSLQAYVDIPTIFSGAASTHYEAVIEGYGLSQDSRVSFTNPSFQYETLLASGSLKAKEASFISKGGDMYLKYDAIESFEMIDEAMKDVIAKYNNIWLGLTEENLLNTLSGSSEEDIVAYQMSQAIGKLRLDDIEEYLTKYPIWKEKKSLGNVDGMSKFEVELAVENIIALIDNFTLKSTGKSMSDDDKKILESDLTARQVMGTLAFDPKNPEIGSLNLTMQSPDGAQMNIVLEEKNEGWSMKASTADSRLNASLTEKGDGYSLTANISEADQEIARIDANILFSGKKFTHFDAKLKSIEDGVSLSLEHNLASNGGFSGTLDAGIGTLNWDGTIGDNLSLKSFRLRGAMIGTSLSLDLTPGTDGILKGPLLLKSGDEVVISATVGLNLSKELLHLTLEVANPETPDITSRAGVRIEGKKEKWTGTIVIPENATPFSELSEALRAVAPADTWTENVSNEELMSDEASYEYSGTDIQNQ